MMIMNMKEPNRIFLHSPSFLVHSVRGGKEGEEEEEEEEEGLA